MSAGDDLEPRSVVVEAQEIRDRSGGKPRHVRIVDFDRRIKLGTGRLQRPRERRRGPIGNRHGYVFVVDLIEVDRSPAWSRLSAGQGHRSRLDEHLQAVHALDRQNCIGTAWRGAVRADHVVGIQRWEHHRHGHRIGGVGNDHKLEVQSGERVGCDRATLGGTSRAADMGGHRTVDIQVGVTGAGHIVEPKLAIDVGMDNWRGH